MDLVFVVVSAVFIGGLFLLAGWQKLNNPRYYAGVIADYKLPGVKGSNFLAVTVGLIELLIGIAVLIPVFRHAGSLSAALMLLIYALAIGLNLLRGRTTIDCGCSGPAARNQQINGWLPARNILLLLIAVGASMEPIAREWVWFDAVVILFALTLVTLVYAGAERLVANINLLKNLRG